MRPAPSSPGRNAAALIVLGTLSLVACEPGRSRPEDTRPVFTDAAPTLGVQFKVTTGASEEHYLVETMLGGVGWLDYDGDGDYDLYLPNGHAKARSARHPGERGNVLYRNDGDKGFTDVTVSAGVGDRRYSHGVSVADYDNDGDSDLLVTNFGRNTLYRNRLREGGSGTFEDVTVSRGLREEGFNMSSAWLDYDRDGDLDLYVVRYLEYWPETARPCHSMGRRGYCHPRLFAGQQDLFYRNDDGERFVEVSGEAGLTKAGPMEGKGLGVIAIDFDRDGWTDLYVANDTTANFLWRNNGDGTFTDVAHDWGVALDENGDPQAGMGVDCGDLNEDGFPDIHVTNFSDESNSLYLSSARGRYIDGVHRCRLGNSYKLLGFGTAFVDVELDGALDLVVANGHVDDALENARDGSGPSYRQRPSLYRNDGEGRFARDAHGAGRTFLQSIVGRGLATADFDDDGDTDLALVALDRPLALLRNDSSERGNFLRIRLVGTKSPRDAYGARLEVTVEGRTRSFDYQSARSYLSACDPRVIIGLGKAKAVDELTIHWPSGAVETRKAIDANQEIVIVEGDEEE